MPLCSKPPFTLFVTSQGQGYRNVFPGGYLTGFAAGADQMFDTRISVLALTGLLTACSTTAREAPAANVCRPDAAAMLVGHAAPDDAQVKQSTGAEVVRRIAPGDQVTHDFRENRITLAIDPAGKVVQAVCG